MVLAYKDGFSKAQELTQAINVIPNQWGLINQLGLFNSEYKTQKQILVPRYTEEEFLLEDRNWDERSPNVVSGQRDELSLKVPHFPITDMITPNDIDGVVSFEDVRAGVDLETVATTRLRKMNTIRRGFSNTLEYARALMITTGEVYSPNGSLRTSYGSTYNWYNEFGVSQTNIDIAFSNVALDPKTMLDAAADAVDTGYKSGEFVEQTLCLCSPEFFDKLTSHPYVKDSVKYINFAGASQELLLGKLGSGGLDSRYQVFEFGRMVFVRYSGSIGSKRFIPANKAYAFPKASGMFRTFFAPKQTFASINTAADEVYWYEEVDSRGTKIEIDAESNFLNFMSDPEAVIQLTAV